MAFFGQKMAGTAGMAGPKLHPWLKWCAASDTTKLGVILTNMARSNYFFVCLQESRLCGKGDLTSDVDLVKNQGGHIFFTYFFDKS